MGDRTVVCQTCGDRQKSINIAAFKFSTKTDTPERLVPFVPGCQVPNFLYFNVGEGIADQASFFTRISGAFINVLVQTLRKITSIPSPWFRRI